MQASRDKIVSMHYTLTADDGNVLDSSTGGEPLSYLHGHGNIVPGLENALEGAKTGFKSRVTVEPADGYGERREEMVIAAPREQFDPAMDLKPGLQVVANGPQGQIIFTVREVSDEEVTLDGNHPLAGQRLHFEVEVTDIRAASEEELSHGHVHGPGGHHH
ncbi:MAG: peptidylprolyl isomerase [Xanthomonadaceae bacterium]|nr:peptidylprolyl isomerase [Xanthomonadaceae bacterium]